jgi:S-adenosylhomocysteine hydrolase
MKFFKRKTIKRFIIGRTEETTIGIVRLKTAAKE